MLHVNAHAAGVGVFDAVGKQLAEDKLQPHPVARDILLQRFHLRRELAIDKQQRVFFDGGAGNLIEVAALDDQIA
ncbi:hypothetical protein SDC9_144662 [bioreactor metagenome]|uniref:Uncharacterized protein n=1 Tax=bioreactor metagenome TaxID=1076179 RepID=A0A645E7T6_9ZZZZ